ncbi:zinc ribbon domain-containing protein [Mucilaginibacter sp. AW1-7]|uniref:zinc ribbon domain-containing protein n=1 Tax=Mucilaginibacter sp. AW1-7 TaxID=3349874 RepID=UPI003F73E4D2
MRPPIATHKELPLRNFLKCPKCNRLLTGSASKGRNNNYKVYYHCTSSCGVRFRAADVNNAFVEEFMQYVPKKGYDELLVETITDCYTNQTRSVREERKDLIAEINLQTKRIDNSREQFLYDELDAAEFRKIKEECNERITRTKAL